MEEAPGHGSDVVKEVERGLDMRVIESASSHEETQVGFDFFCGTVGDAPVVQSISA